MTQIEHLREQAARAERLARSVLDATTVARLMEASSDYRKQADCLEQRNRCGTVAQEPMRIVDTRAERPNTTPLEPHIPATTVTAATRTDY